VIHIRSSLERQESPACCTLLGVLEQEIEQEIVLLLLLLGHRLILVRFLLQIHLALCHLARVFGLLFEVLETLHLEALR
jgi:hypothetical protein